MGARINFTCMPNNRGRTFFDLNDEKLVAVINPQEGDGAGLASSQGNNQNDQRKSWTVWKLTNSEKKYAN